MKMDTVETETIETKPVLEALEDAKVSRRMLRKDTENEEERGCTKRMIQIKMLKPTNQEQ
jgi:hypothetical protein